MSTKVDLMRACLSSSTLINYLEERGINHNNYKVYTREERLSSWKSEGGFFLNDGASWNDIDDRLRLNPKGEKQKRFGTCFSFSRSENVAMWMLYGRMTHTGIMVDFLPTDIKNIIRTETISLGRWISGKFIEEQVLEKGHILCLLKKHGA